MYAPARTAETPSEFSSALGNLQRIFGGFLWDVKSNSCFTAWSEIKLAKNGKTKNDIFEAKLQQWREGSVTVVREWLPKFVALAEAYPDPNDLPTLQRARHWVWAVVEGQCGVRPPEKAEITDPREGINRSVLWWFAVASGGNTEANMLPLRPWKAPRWLALGSREKDLLLRRSSSALKLRLAHAINEELDLAQIETAIAVGHAILRQTEAAAEESTSQFEGLSDKASKNVDSWSFFYTSFERLSREERAASLKGKNDRRVSASSTGEMKEWVLRTGINENFHARLTLLLTQAGAKLGAPEGWMKLNYWVQRLYLELQRSRSKLLFAPIQEDPKCVSIESVCEASAIFCAQLEREAVEIAKVESRQENRREFSAVSPHVKLG